MRTHKFCVHQMRTQNLPPIAIMLGILSGAEDDTRLVTAWRDLLDRHARTTSALERSLHEHGLGVSEYEVLERLATGEEDERRMQDLADAVHLSQSALSRVVARLEGDGLVVRTMCTSDRRGIFACLTDAGRERYAAARPAHRAVLAAALNA
jgi:DNA-binding MarR family transcriptional regulator